MRSEEESIYSTFPAELRGEIKYDGYGQSEVMVLTLWHPDGSLRPRPGGWVTCLRCHRHYQPRKSKKNGPIIPFRGTYQILHGKIVLQIPRPRPKAGHCRGCGKPLNDKPNNIQGEK